MSVCAYNGFTENAGSFGGAENARVETAGMYKERHGNQ